MSARRWNELGVLLVVLAALCASVGYYGPPTWGLFIVGAAIAVGARRSAPNEFRADT
jgi:hypothetical protein